MDVSQELADHAAKHSTVTEERGVPIVVDAGLLAAFDYTPLDEDDYENDLATTLISLTRNTTQTLLASLFTLPTNKSSLGPLAILPPAATALPREKPLPKPKPETTWERFAKAKGISHVKKDKDVWDEERQAFVPRWGRGGKSREKEEQWIHEVKAGAGADLDPAVTAKLARKSRVAKNLRQQAVNTSKAAASATPITPSSTTPKIVKIPGKTLRMPKGSIPKDQVGLPSQADKKSARERRAQELERGLLVSKASTASLGRFDKKIEGEPKARGIKRKFEPTAAPTFKPEKESAMSILSSLDRPAAAKAKSAKGGAGEEGGLNTRKAVRFQARMDRARGVAGKGGKPKTGRAKR